MTIFVIIDKTHFPSKESYMQVKKGGEAKKISKSKWFDLYENGIDVLPPLTVEK